MKIFDRFWDRFLRRTLKEPAQRPALPVKRAARGVLRGPTVPPYRFERVKRRRKAANRSRIRNRA